MEALTEQAYLEQAGITLVDSSSPAVLPVVTLRDYQQSLLESIRREIESGKKRILIVLPTGGGKSVIFREIARGLKNKGKTGMIVAHRDELVRQAYQHCLKSGILASEIGIIKYGYPMEDKPIQVASIQTLANREFENCHVYIYDEAHHCPADIYQAPMSRPGIHLGFTATPVRSDNRGLSDYFETMIVGALMQELIRDGYLADIKFIGRPPLTDPVDIFGDAARTWRQYCDGIRSLAFCQDIEHSLSVASMYNSRGIPALHVDGYMNLEERRDAIRRFIKGEVLVLCNYNIFSEGFDLGTFAELEKLDAVDIGAVQLLRKMGSVSMYMQAVGRALRPAAGKQFGVVIDHCGNYDLHGDPRDIRWHFTQGAVRNQQQLEELLEQEEEARQAQANREIVVDPNGNLIEVDRRTKYWALIQMVEAKGQPAVYDWIKTHKPTIEEIITACKNYLGWKPRRGYNLWVELGGCPDSFDHLKKIATALGYHWRWAIHERGRFGL